MTLSQCYRANGGWMIRFEYDAEKVEALKQAIPHTLRSWDPEAKLWWVHGAHEDTLLKLFPGFESFLNQPRLFE